MKNILLAIFASSLFAFIPAGEFSKWSVQPKKSLNASTPEDAQTYSIPSNDLNKIVVFFDVNDTLVVTEAGKYSGNKKAKRKLEVIAGTSDNILFSRPVTNTRINKIEIPVKNLNKNNAKDFQYEIIEVVNLNGYIKKSSIVSFAIN